MKRLFAIAVALVLLAGGATVALRLTHPKAMFAWAEDAASTHGNALWHIVHELCTPDMKASGNPAPCVSVDLTAGYAVLKDIQGKTQYLLIPTARVTGIESPELLAPGSPNYWAAAWDARKLVEARLGHPVPREDIGLAVNSMNGRTQNQLHIHIDCLHAGVRDALQRQERRLGVRWTTVILGRYQHKYRVRWLAGADLGDRDPFKILADTDPAARANMGGETLAVVGASRPNGALGFILLSDPGDGTPHDEGAAEELLDHGCAVAETSTAPTP
jgi:CDP-diacylglycerol pyrophosphatase